MNDAEKVVKQLIIPPLEAEKQVSQSGSVYLRDCPCRVEMKNCSPEKWDVCILFDFSLRRRPSERQADYNQGSGGDNQENN